LWKLFAEACQLLLVTHLSVVNSETGEAILEIAEPDKSANDSPLQWRFENPCSGSRFVWTMCVAEDTDVDADIIYRYVYRLLKSTSQKVEQMRMRNDVPEMATSTVAEGVTVAEIRLPISPKTLEAV
jgi:hypothetical protein